MSRNRRNFSPEFKFQAAMDCLTGRKRRVDVVREHQLSDSTLERWCQKVLKGGSRVFASRDQSILAEEERRIAELNLDRPPAGGPQ